MKPILMLTVILSLVAATAKAHADEGKDQPTGGRTVEPDALPTSQPTGDWTAEPGILPIRLPAWAADAPRTGAASTLVKLQAMLKSSDPKTRAAAATELIWVEEKAVADLLVKTLASDPSAHVRQAAAQALRRRDVPSALAPLSRAARHDTSPAVRDAAGLAIRQIRWSSSRAARFLDPLPPNSGRTTKNAGTAFLIAGPVVGAGLLVAALFAAGGPYGPAYDGDSASEQYQRQSSSKSVAPAVLAIAGLVTVVASVITGLILRRKGKEQIRTALDARSNVAISSSGGQLDLAWTF